MFSAAKLKKLSSFHKVIIFILLLFFWIVMTMLFILKYEDRFFSLVFRHNGVFAKSQNINLTQGNVLSGSFYSPEDNLGSVSFLFNSHNRAVRDTIRFRIKEKNNSHWYYESDYNTAAFFGLPQYPFGFPLIYESQGKEYYFEMESLYGVNNNHVTIGIKNQHIESKHVFSKKLLLKGTQDVLIFSNKKIINLIQDRDAIYAIFVNMLPLIFYLLITYIDSKIHFNKYINSSAYGQIISMVLKVAQYTSPYLQDKVAFKIRQFEKNNTMYFYELFLPLLTVLLIFWDIFFITKIIGFIAVIISIMWIIVSQTFNFSYKVSLVFALVLIVLLPLSLLLELVIEPQKIGLWIYMMLVTMAIIYYDDVIERNVRTIKRWIQSQKIFTNRKR